MKGVVADISFHRDLPENTADRGQKAKFYFTKTALTFSSKGGRMPA